MEKVIKLTMKENKDIEIFVDSILTHTIQFNNREISAEKIVEIFNVSLGDMCKVEKENLVNKDNKVLDMFAELFQEIANKINSIFPAEDQFVIGTSVVRMELNQQEKLE